MVTFKPVQQTLDSGLTLRGWCTENRGLPVITFLHGNGFSAGTYFPLLRLLAGEYDLLMLDLPGHGSSDATSPYPGWNTTAEMMYEGMQKLLGGCSSPVYLVGHSLGGVLALLTACRHPRAFSGLVLLDPVLFPQRMLLGMRLLSWFGLTARVHPFVTPTLKRKCVWDSREAAFAYLHGRKIYKGWSDEALKSFTSYALTDRQQAGVTLSCSPQLEAHYFSSLPDGLWSAITSFSGSAHLLMGEDSYPFAKKAARIAAIKNNRIKHSIVPGGHCFMQEFPDSTSNRIFAAIREF
ncbi:hypothetical protein AB833_02955 [Chromatiales bacterium (ex Bugula neritina AB1)]|nr:hypothetical protein AB833_02955 [Chromatiales bacterium (ex Bugula neritina AB1)]